MTKPMSLYLPDLLNSSVPFRRVGTVLLVSLALIAVCPEVAKATDSEIAPGLQQSQQDQQREQQQRDQQAREQQQREQQQRDQQARDQQQREQQQRDQQARDQQQRAQQQQPASNQRTTADRNSQDAGKPATAPHVLDTKPEKQVVSKPTEPGLRRPNCEGKPCESVSKPVSTQPDLRHRVCLNGNCGCPDGQVESKKGCVPLATAKALPTQRVKQCQPGEVLNGSACVPSTTCQPGQSWNGASCVPSTTCQPGQIRTGAACHSDCSIVNAEAGSWIPQVRSARQDRDEACRQDPSGMQCQQLSGHYTVTLEQYRSIWAGAPVDCQITLPVPDTI